MYLVLLGFGFVSPSQVFLFIFLVETITHAAFSSSLYSGFTPEAHHAGPLLPFSRSQGLRQDRVRCFEVAGLGSIFQLQPLLQSGIDFTLRRILWQSFSLGADIEPLKDLGGVLQLATFRPGIGCATPRATVQPEGKVMEEATVTQRAAVRSLARAVHAAVQLQVDVLRELGATHFALVGLLSRVQAQVRLQVAGAAKALLAHL